MVRRAAGAAWGCIICRSVPSPITIDLAVAACVFRPSVRVFRVLNQKSPGNAAWNVGPGLFRSGFL